ncbi:hypothetical protein A6C57_00205 [Fibrella sp. ES10-3-2-2]|nr:hypothetical protein A6C57_00205 [Fibrella sp. ES10-3-2-2]
MDVKTWKQRYERYKAYYGYTNEDIARIAGLTSDTVRVLTGKEKTFPRWMRVGIVGFEKDHNMFRLSLDTLEPFEVEESTTAAEPAIMVKTTFIRPDGAVICRSEPGDRFTVLHQIGRLMRTDGAGRGWKIDEIAEREYTADGKYIERTYSGDGLDHLFD